MSNQITPIFVLEDGSVVPMEMMEPQASHGGPAVPAPKAKIVKDIAGGIPIFEVDFPLGKIDSPGDTVRILTATPPATAGLTTEDHTIFFGYFEKQDL